MVVLLCLAALFVGAEMRSFTEDIEISEVLVEKRASACFTSIGCFTTDPPFSAAERGFDDLPESPDRILTKFELFTRQSPNTPQTLDARQATSVATHWTHFEKRPTQFIIHGFLTNPSRDHWLRDMKDELLKHGDYNVVITDWSHGNSLPYTGATANTRVVGAQIAVVIHELIKSKGVAASSFHLIGHSLGAHTAGYAGERVPGLGRITGLDPAGPLFDNSPKVVRLDPTDAVFVDVIHSDAKNLLHLGFGTVMEVGHSDFYPNLGHDQPGCGKSPQGIADTIACSHQRSVTYFTESINTHCPFLAFPCASEDDFTHNRCHTCTSAGCAPMGFNAKSHIPPAGKQVKYYLTTADHASFCQYHLDMTVKFSAGKGTEERGSLQVVAHGAKGSTKSISLVEPSHPSMFKQGTSYQYFVGSQTDVGAIHSVSFTWHHDSSLLNPSQWNILGLRHPTLYLDEFDVHSEEANDNVRFCLHGQGVETDSALTISTKC